MTFLAWIYTLSGDNQIPEIAFWGCVGVSCSWERNKGNNVGSPLEGSDFSHLNTLSSEDKQLKNQTIINTSSWSSPESPTPSFWSREPIILSDTPTQRL